MAETHNEDKTAWSAFLRHFQERALKGLQLVTSDACLGLTESLAERGAVPALRVQLPR